jgi:hypothetical protein
MSINALSEAIKALAQSLQVPTILPSIIFVLVNALFVLPRDPLKVDMSSPYVVTFLITLVLAISYALYAFNFPIIRFLEGYKLRNTDISKGLQKRQEGKYLGLIQQIRDCNLTIARIGLVPEHERDTQKRISLMKLASLKRRLDYEFSPNDILPSKLGNTIAAFEHYPRSRYGIDAVTLWPRMIPILKEQKYIEFVAQEKAVFDFLLNSGVIVLALGTEFFYLGLLRWDLLLSMGAITTIIPLLGVLYQGLIIAARQWGDTVRVAFDLYRDELHHKLGIAPDDTFEKEYERWIEVSQFLGFREDVILFTNFTPQTQRLRE